MNKSPIDAAKDYLANSTQYGHMEDGVYTVADHDTHLDSHMIAMLPGVEHSDLRDSDYNVVTVHKNVPVEGTDDVMIPKIVKIQVSKTDNSVQSVLESK